MIDGDVNEFVDNLYYGTEMFFKYKDVTYFIEGWVDENNDHLLFLDDYYNALGLNEHGHNSEKCVYAWKYKSKDSSECVQAFLKAPLFDGKTFWEVENEITWTDE